MAATGIGFAGIDGAWWLPAVAPVSLPAGTLDELPRLGRALFALYDALADLYDSADDLRALLTHEVAVHIPRLVSPAPVLMLRPDFQLVPDGTGLRLVATELEIAPASQGFAHAMQMGYGLETDLADAFVRFLNGRPLFIVATEQWSELLFDQLAFCRALAERGVTAHVLLDRPIAAIADDVAQDRRWVPPLFGVRTKTPDWNSDVMGRLRAGGLERFLWAGHDWPESVGDSIVFRFGYFDNFDPALTHTLARWQAAGATFLNPPTTYLESKSVLAAASLARVRDYLAARDAAILATLDRCLPETMVLTQAILPLLLRDRPSWVIKYAGYDGDNQSWGGKSVQFGRAQSDELWRRSLDEALAAPWPVVAQRLVPSVRRDIDYFDAANRTRRLVDGHTRLRVFFLRDGESVFAGGAYLTLSATAWVAESTDAVQAPIIAASSQSAPSA